MPLAWPVDMRGSVGFVHAYPRNPVSHTAVSKLLPAMGKFLVRGDYEHHPIQNVCLGLGPTHKHSHWYSQPCAWESRAVDRVECVIYSLWCAHTGCDLEWGFGGDVQPLVTKGRWRNLMSPQGPAVTSGHQASGRWLAWCGNQVISTGKLDG